MSSRFDVFAVTSEWLSGHQDASGLFIKKIVESTNDLAKTEAFAKTTPDEKIYLTDIQTKGRGRSTNTWTSPPAGDALLMTWSWRLTNAAQAITAPLMGLHIYRALTKVFIESQLSLKPPNDIYLYDKKILGILAEALQQGPQHRLLVGFGLNVFSAPAGVVSAGFLNDSTDTDQSEVVTKASWFKFLESLVIELRMAMKNSQRSEMSPEDCQELLTAIQQHPSGRNYTRVHANGNLDTKQNGVISWRDL